MNEYETILKVAKFMLDEDILSQFGFKILHNEIVEDIKTLKPNEQQKLVRISLYLTIVFNMTLLFGGFLDENKNTDWIVEFETMKKISLDFHKVLPKYLKGLNDYYLEKYHEAKTGIFVKNIFELHQEMPIHPNEQKYHDIMKKATEAK
jgi:hypothetical protein